MRDINLNDALKFARGLVAPRTKITPDQPSPTVNRMQSLMKKPTVGDSFGRLVVAQSNVGRVLAKPTRGKGKTSNVHSAASKASLDVFGGLFDMADRSPRVPPQRRNDGFSLN